MEHEFKEGDIVVLKTNWNKKYTFIQADIDNIMANLIDSEGQKTTLPIATLEKYDAVRALGI